MGSFITNEIKYKICVCCEKPTQTPETFTNRYTSMICDNCYEASEQTKVTVKKVHDSLEELHDSLEEHMKSQNQAIMESANTYEEKMINSMIHP